MTQEGPQHWGSSGISLISIFISERLSQTSKFPVFGVSKITCNNSSLTIAVSSCFEKWSHIAPLLVSNYKLIIPQFLLIKSPKKKYQKSSSHSTSIFSNMSNDTLHSFCLWFPTTISHHGFIAISWATPWREAKFMAPSLEAKPLSPKRVTAQRAATLRPKSWGISRTFKRLSPWSSKTRGHNL